MVATYTLSGISAVWIASALLQREAGARGDFAAREVIDRVAEMGLTSCAPSTVKTYAYSDFIASRPADPAHLRMLTITARGRRRLFRRGDPSHGEREKGPTHPEADELPPDYRYLVNWYADDYDATRGTGEEPLLRLRRIAIESGIWKGVDPDRYVAELREG